MVMKDGSVTFFKLGSQHGYRCFISILRWQDRLCLYNEKVILTGCCLVKRIVKVISTDVEHGPIYQRINNTQFVSFFVYMGENHDTVLEC